MRRPARRARALSALAALLAAARLGASDCAPPKLTVRVTDLAPKQGGVVAVVLESDTALSGAALRGGPDPVPMGADASARSFRALYGVDFETKAGARTIRIEAQDRCGGVHAVTRSVSIRPGGFVVQKLRVDPGYVEVPPEQAARVAADRARVAKVWAAAATPRRWSAAFTPPVPTAAGGNFGARRVFNGKTKSRHQGVDLPGRTGDPITAPAPGTVVLAGDLYFSGGTVILDHGEGLFTTYFHLSKIDVTEGQAVTAGQKLGGVGATGRATGPHLHWGARVNGARVNPLNLLRLPDWPISD